MHFCIFFSFYFFFFPEIEILAAKRLWLFSPLSKQIRQMSGSIDRLLNFKRTSVNDFLFSLFHSHMRCLLMMSFYHWYYIRLLDSQSLFYIFSFSLLILIYLFLIVIDLQELISSFLAGLQRGTPITIYVLSLPFLLSVTLYPLASIFQSSKDSYIYIYICIAACCSDERLKVSFIRRGFTISIKLDHAILTECLHICSVLKDEKTRVLRCCCCCACGCLLYFSFSPKFASIFLSGLIEAQRRFFFDVVR